MNKDIKVYTFDYQKYTALRLSRKKHGQLTYCGKDFKRNCALDMLEEVCDIDNILDIRQEHTRRVIDRLGMRTDFELDLIAEQIRLKNKELFELIKKYDSRTRELITVSDEMGGERIGL